MTDPSHSIPAGLADASAEDRFAILWTDYLEGFCTPPSMGELDALFAAHPRLLTRAADLYQTHRLLGLVAFDAGDDAALPVSDRFVADVMVRLPADSEALTKRVMVELATATRNNNDRRSRLTDDSRQISIRRRKAAGLLMVAVMIGACVTWFMQTTPEPTATSVLLDGEGPAKPPVRPVRFANRARARFLGRDTPPLQAAAVPQDHYVLSEGFIELVFPNGASAILEGPAAFRICGEDCLAVDTGRCSVHAPDGAEGFQIETPTSRIIDRGTRFVVNVDEASATEVQVVEGTADLVVTGDSTAPVFHMVSGDRVRHDPATPGAKIVPAGSIDRTTYRHRLPDRIIRYAASLAHPVPLLDGDVLGPGIDTLDSITVQRNGVAQTYDATELIGVRLVHMSANRNKNNLTLPGSEEFDAGKLHSPEVRRGVLESDHLLTTGVINPGGAMQPLAADPVLKADRQNPEVSPGLAVTFRRPVVNGIGPDVIFIELQMLTDPPEGDAFHVSPLRFATGLRSHSVTTYDIDSTSSESLVLARFRLFAFDSLPASLDALLAKPTNSGSLPPVRARANAVGIDLSDLGYAAGAVCEGLFFQDADDDKTTIDPVFIAGLPAAVQTQSSPVESSQ